MKIGIVSKNHYLEYTDVYRGIQFVVLFISGGYRTAYINVKNTRLENVGYMKCDDYVDVHYGFTYKDNRLPFELECNDSYTWLGWDYAHCSDGYDLSTIEKYFGQAEYHKMMKSYDFGLFASLSHSGHVYTLTEVVDECKRAIDEVIRNENNN